MRYSVHIMVADDARRQRLKNSLHRAGDFGSVCDDPDIVNCAQPVDLYIVDLSHPFAALPVFWMVTHVLNPRARRMGLFEPSIIDSVLQTALHAGAYYMASWEDPPERLLAVARAASTGQGYVPLGEPLRAMLQVFDKLNWDRQSQLKQVLCVNLVANQVSRGGQFIHLTPLERKLILYLTQHAGWVISYNELSWAVWGERSGTHKAFEQLKRLVQRLRGKIELDPRQPHIVRNEYGQGYFVARHLIQIHASPHRR